MTSITVDNHREAMQARFQSKYAYDTVFKRESFWRDHIYPEHLTQFNNVLAAFNNVYGDNFSMILQNVEYSGYTTYTADATCYFTRILFIVHYPSITIQNSRGDKRILKDLYVAHPVMMRQSSNSLEFCNPLGARGTVSVVEFVVGYRHSHLETVPDDFGFVEECSPGFTDFCTGGDQPIDQARITMIDEGFDIDFVELYLHLCNEFVTWESIEGGPHIHIEDIQWGGKGRQRDAQRSLSVWYKVENNTPFLQSLYYACNNAGSAFDKEFIINTSPGRIAQLMAEFDITSEEDMGYSTRTGRWLGYEVKTNEDYHYLFDQIDNDYNLEMFNYRGEPRYFEIELEYQLDNSNLIKTLSPHTISYVTKEITDRINRNIRLCPKETVPTNT